MFRPLNSERLRSTVSTSAPCTSIEMRRPSGAMLSEPELELDGDTTGSGAGGGSGAPCSSASTTVFPTALTPYEVGLARSITIREPVSLPQPISVARTDLMDELSFPAHVRSVKPSVDPGQSSTMRSGDSRVKSW
jgi:hypothetical protein